jgi:hypothetical protein
VVQKAGQNRQKWVNKWVQSGSKHGSKVGEDGSKVGE